MQWLDEPSLEAFLFAGRRLDAEGVVMLGSLREGTAVAGMEVPSLEGLRVEPLADDGLARAARRVAGRALAPSVTDRLVETAAGNPLALLEIPRQLSDGQRAGREPLEDLLRPAPASSGRSGATSTGRRRDATRPAGGRQPRTPAGST